MAELKYDPRTGRWIYEPRARADVRLKTNIQIEEAGASRCRERAEMFTSMAEDHEQQAQIFRDALAKWQTDAAYEAAG